MKRPSLRIMRKFYTTKSVLCHLSRCQCYKTFFSSSLTMRPNKLEHLPLETLSSQVLEFEGKVRQTRLEHLSDASFLGKPLVFPANVRLDWKVIASTNTLAYLASTTGTKEKCFITLTPGAQILTFLSKQIRSKTCGTTSGKNCQ